MQIVHLEVHPTESQRSSASWPVVFKSARQLVHHNHLRPFKSKVLSNFSLSDERIQRNVNTAPHLKISGI